MLNDKRELQIEGNIIKVTEEGTYLCEVGKYDRLLEILKSKPKHGDSNNGNDVAGDFKTLEPGIIFYDSFASSKNEVVSDFKVVDSEVFPNPATNNARVHFDYLPASVYDSFETHKFGKHTIVGQWIESAFGNKENQYVYFSDNERLKLSFFDVSYVVYKSIGIKAKAQHKTWIGWGGDLVSPEMRMGWDGLAFSVSLPYSPSTNIPTTNFSTLSFKNFGIQIASFDALDGYVSDPIANSIKGAVNGAINEALSTTVSKVYQLLRNHLGSQNNWEKNFTAAFRLHYPDKVVHVLGRHEEIENNTDEMNRLFDWATPIIGLKLSGSNQTFIYKEGTTHDIIKGSVYASCTRSGRTIGVRIIKD